LPELNWSLTLRVLSAFARPTLNQDAATDLSDYYLERNEVAHQSHCKSWLPKRRQLVKKLLLEGHWGRDDDWY
jgi:hypothetical protein